jgi:hypothetical protein
MKIESLYRRVGEAGAFAFRPLAFSPFPAISIQPLVRPCVIRSRRCKPVGGRAFQP